MPTTPPNPDNAPPPMPDDGPGWSGKKTLFVLLCVILVPMLLLVIFNDSIFVKAIGFVMIVVLLRYVSRMGRSFRDL